MTDTRTGGGQGSSPAGTQVFGESLGARDIRQVFGETLVESGRRDRRLIVLDCQTAVPTMAISFARAFPERFVDLAVAEQNAVSFAAGLARVGLIPILPLFACFVTRRALDQISTQVAYPALNVKVCGVYAGLTSPNTGATHQMLQDLAIMRSLPHMTIIEPADAVELSQALPAAIARPGPVYFRMVRGDLGGPCPRVSPDGYAFQLGQATVLREGKDITLIGSGLMVSRCVQAAETLAREGISADVVNVSTVKPLDEWSILERVGRTGAVVTAENHTILGGLGGAVAELLGETRPVPLRRVGVRDCFGESAPLEALLPHYGLTAEAVVEAARAALAAKSHQGGR
jgi:transketolase